MIWTRNIGISGAGTTSTSFMVVPHDVILVRCVWNARFQSTADNDIATAQLNETGVLNASGNSVTSDVISEIKFGERVTAFASQGSGFWGVHELGIIIDQNARLYVIGSSVSGGFEATAQLVFMDIPGAQVSSATFGKAKRGRF